jgi:TolB-like protein/DNA-binding winged helix-turn-helix (wHTH) protein/Tfp pilus assembly protein PilF
MQVPATDSRQARFGAFVVDFASHELRHNGCRIKLQEKPYQILSILLQRPGELVTREEVRQKLWHSDTFVDFEHGINTAMRKLRDALVDNAEQPHFIETLPKRGYRFIAPIEVSASLVHSSGVQALEPEANPIANRWWKSRTIWLFAATTLAVLAITSAVLWRSPQSAGAQTRIMLAVLPFDNLSADPSEDYFAEGVTEELITHLGRWNPERLGVIARTSSDVYKHASKTVAQVGRELGVDYIVEGSARRDGKQIRITAQLIQVRDQTHVWAKAYDRDAGRVLALENEVAADVANEISVKLSPGAHLNSASVDPEAHENFLKGQYYWHQLTCRGFETALPLFENALRRDPTYAAAEAALAATYYKLADFGCRPRLEMIPKAKSAALKAVQLDSQMAEAHAVLGIVADQYDWDRKTAERELKLATRLDPNDALAHIWYGAILCQKGRQELCLAELRKAHELDPVALITNIVNAYMLYYARQYDSALDALHKTLELYPDSGLAYRLRGEIYERKREHGKAADAYLKARKLGGQPAAVLGRYESAITRHGLKGYWTEELREATGRNPPNHCATIPIYAHLIDKVHGLGALERGYREQCVEMSGLRVDPLYDFLRSEPRFEAALEKIGFRE